MAAGTKIPQPPQWLDRPVGGQGFLNVEASQSHSVGLLCTNDQPNAETTHNTHKGQTYMPSVGFEAAIPVSERPQTFALDRAATGIGRGKETAKKILLNSKT